MGGLAKRLSGAIVALVLVAACGEVVVTGGFVARVPTADAETPDLRVILAHEFAAEEANAGWTAKADGRDTTRKAIAHELESDGPPRRSSRDVIDLPVR